MNREPDNLSYQISMEEDIRDKARLDHEDIVRLNFIRKPGVFLYRRHYRAGLRSHIMEVLNPEDVEREKEGVIINGLRHFPKAIPLKMLRVFRKRFNNLKYAEEELRNVKILEKFLRPDCVARSDEFLVHYARKDQYELIICGLQEYVEGEILDPWSHLDKTYLVSLLSHMGFERHNDSEAIADRWVGGIRENGVKLIEKLKQMIFQTNRVPDLAGVGNLILTRSGNIKLVDINNISRVSFDRTIPIDDRGYPVCDKSIEALSLLERKLIGRSLDGRDIIYNTFLDPLRMKEVKKIETRFHALLTEDRAASGAGQYIHRS
ncbi:MAG: hypothetical protein JRF53_05400 [Deltaproteobacteria bacterium]|nr:hypothetical protein [Deltaproteobacteria bacterium]MBW2343436.1 hypothetical protein [Deltaproteobacteria bacterium]